MTGRPRTISREVQATLDKSWNKARLIEILETTAPTFYRKLALNDWSDKDIKILREHNVIGRVGRSSR